MFREKILNLLLEQFRHMKLQEHVTWASSPFNNYIIFMIIQ
jgi:hypothetical protein